MCKGEMEMGCGESVAEAGLVGHLRIVGDM